MMRSLAEHGIPALDLAPLFRNEEQPMSLWVSRDDAHPNSRAHALISQYSLPFLLEAAASNQNSEVKTVKSRQ